MPILQGSAFLYNGGMGRKTLYNADIHKEICDNVQIGMSYEDSATLVGISEPTLYDWIKKYPKFSKDIKEAKTKCKRSMVTIVRQAARKTWTAAAWWLERRYPKEFAKRQIHGVATSDVDGAKELAERIFADVDDDDEDSETPLD